MSNPWSKRMPKKRATEDALGELHEALAMKLKHLLNAKHYKVVKNKAGEEIGIEEQTPPALLNVIRQFLKDNNIEADPKKYRETGEFVQPEDLEDYPFDGEPKH